LWLPPKTWLHGSQSQITGFCELRKGQMMDFISALEHIMRWVVITALGVPTEPEVNRNLAMVSGVTALKARP
jgi:hypothetical protein